MRLFSIIGDLLYKMRRRIATAVVGLVIGLVAFHVVFGANGMLVYQQKRNEYKALDTQLQNLQKENETLGQHIKALKTDPKMIEKEAREQLHYVRPGEVVFSMPSAKTKAPTATAQK